MKIAIIGCGAMGSAFAKHFAKKHSVILCDHHADKARSLAADLGGSFEEKIRDAVRAADVVFLAVKPKDMPALAQEIQGSKILISILAGTPIALLKRHFPSALIVRTMPNMGILYGQGVVGLVEDEEISAKTKATIDSLVEGMGLSLWMSESKVEAITALSGSGIAFVLAMIEALIDGGVQLGFSSEEAREIVLKTVEGAIALMRESGEQPADLRLQIASPGGTTLAGLKAMEEREVRSGIISALIASHEKALNMSS